MIIVRRDIRVAGSCDLRIRHITDVHQGSEGFNERLFRKFITCQKKDPSSFWIGTGDLVDDDRPSMRERKRGVYSDRQDARGKLDKMEYDWLDRYVIPLYAPIARQSLGILDGDHYIEFGNGDTSGKYISRRLGIPYLGDRMAFVMLSIQNSAGQRASYTILARHGKGFASTHGGDVSALQRQNTGFIADLYLGGHTHKEFAIPVQMIYPDKVGRAIKQKVVWYVRGGSFLWGYPEGKKTYAEEAEYNPLCNGWAEIGLSVHKHGDNGLLSVGADYATLRVA